MMERGDEAEQMLEMARKSSEVVKDDVRPGMPDIILQVLSRGAPDTDARYISPQRVRMGCALVQWQAPVVNTGCQINKRQDRLILLMMMWMQRQTRPDRQCDFRDFERGGRESRVIS
jgi:hypothetical protein